MSCPLSAVAWAAANRSPSPLSIQPCRNALQSASRTGRGVMATTAHDTTSLRRPSSGKQWQARRRSGQCRSRGNVGRLLEGGKRAAGFSISLRRSTIIFGYQREAMPLPFSPVRLSEAPGANRIRYRHNGSVPKNRLVDAVPCRLSRPGYRAEGSAPAGARETAPLVCRPPVRRNLGRLLRMSHPAPAGGVAAASISGTIRAGC